LDVNRLTVLTIGCIVALALTTAATPVAADEQLDNLIQTLRSDLGQRRNSALSTLVKLEGEQKKAFWALTGAYDKELRKITERRVALIKEFSGIASDPTPEQARSIADRSFDISDARTALHRKFFHKIADEISVVAAVQFIQLQSQFETMADAKIAASVPLAGF
jgi:hypothetical protein